ncbi:glycoside hydrolase family 5 protein [Homoserinibacter sp. GY 40078]|uniref:glycoside hydrolase family 5 protein n=1 Tax=Homoserinibacter sp. GY 40078 TaxID=2603275 RepID=UPI00164FDEEB|nr:cellulase family glycosylhydrolase [Homoserinibacter sp. GY 40078]
MTFRVTATPQIDGALRRGVNLSHWYSQVYTAAGYSTEHFDRYLSDDDFRLIAATGFDHVRFPFSWEWMFGDPATTDAAIERIVDNAIRLQHAGLSVIVDAHPEMEFKASLRDPDSAAAFVAGWGRLAARLAELPTDRTAIEILNEPSTGDAATWHAIARGALANVREHCPDHLVIVSGDGYSELPQLLDLPVFDDPRLVYNFHMYDPMIISHQSAHFAADWVRAVTGLIYPTDAENVRSRIASDVPERTRGALIDYLEEPWGLGRYRAHIRDAVTFANDRGVALTCNEFGIYREAPRATRIAWLGDVSLALSDAGIGWSVWDYAGDFAVAPGLPGKRVADPEIVAAMGLTPPS